MIFDLHTHTTSSNDGHNTPEEMCEAAIAAGIEVLAFTEHWDAFEKYNAGMLDDDGGYVPFREDDLRRHFFAAREKYAGKIKLLYGIELGEPNVKKNDAYELLLRQNFDMVLGSVHNIDGDTDIIPLDYTRTPVSEMMGQYLARVYETTKLGLADTVSHLDYPLRYIPMAEGEKRTMMPYKEQAHEILREAAAKGIALEINGAGLVKATKCVGPERWIIEDYLSLGGEYITYGSDAHFTHRLLNGYAQSMALAMEAGVKYGVYFEGRRPHPFKLA